MKALNCCAILISLQLVFLKSSEASGIKLEGLQKMRDLYTEKMNSADDAYVEQFKNVCEQVLKDKRIQEASTPFISEFKENITEYLTLYPIYQHYYLNNELLQIISDMIISYTTSEPSDDKEFQYIVDLLRKHGSDEINLKYDGDFEQFMNSTILPEFKVFASELLRKERDLRYEFLLWLHDINDCYDYDCYLKSYNDLSYLLETPKNTFFELLYDKYDEITIMYAANINETLNSLLNSSELTKLNTNLKENFTKDCNDYLSKYETNADEANLMFLIEIFNNITLKYYDNIENINANDEELLRTILTKHKLKKPVEKYQQEFKDFIERYLPVIFDNYKNSTAGDDSESKKKLQLWYDNIKQLTTHEERIKEFHKVYDLQED